MIPAQPNNNRIRFEIINAEKDKQVDNKYHLSIKVLPLQSHQDKRFIKTGDIYEADAFTALPDIVKNEAVLEGDAEYLGGPAGGRIVLNNIA